MRNQSEGFSLFNSLFPQAFSRPSSAPTPTVHSNFKSNMAGRVNDRELITLARTYNAYTAG